MLENNQKIVQLVPALPGIFAQYKDDDNDSFTTSPIVCFALIEEKREDGTISRYVSPLEMGPDGIVDECATAHYLFPQPATS